MKQGVYYPLSEGGKAAAPHKRYVAFFPAAEPPQSTLSPDAMVSPVENYFSLYLGRNILKFPLQLDFPGRVESRSNILRQVKQPRAN